MHPSALINVNGQILPAREARVSVFDRGYLYGDSLYEVARTYHGKLYLLDEHLERLEKSAELCRLSLGQTRAQYRAEVLRALEAFQRSNAGVEAYVRIIISRGTGRIGFGINCVETTTQYSIIVQPVDLPNEKQLERGLKLQISARLRNHRRALDPAMKSGNYLNSLLAYLEATEAGYDDALLCNGDGHLTEGTTFNIFYIRRKIVATPPLDIGILEGITRRKIMADAMSLGYEVREVRFPAERLYEADEVFISGSVREVFPVTQVDKHVISSGKPGPITTALRHAYQKGLP